MKSDSSLLTLRDLRRLHFPRVPFYRLKYAISSSEIEPRDRAGIIRLFGADQVPIIAEALRRTAERQGAHA